MTLELNPERLPHQLEAKVLFFQATLKIVNILYINGQNFQFFFSVGGHLEALNFLSGDKF